MMRHELVAAFVLLLATAARAQMTPIFDPDDFVDARQHAAAVFDSRLAIGAVSNFIDDYRPLHQNVAFLHISNNFYWKRFQFAWKHSEMHANDDGPQTVTMCGCSPPIYFPTPPGPDSTPAAPLPSRKDMLQVGGYFTRDGAPGDPPMMLRFRLSWSRQPIDTVVRSGSTEELSSRLSGREQAFGADVDTYYRIGGHNLFGSLMYARNVRTGTTDDRKQRDLTYTARFPGTSYKSVLFRATMTVGAISGRGGTGIDLVNPAFEAFWHHDWSRANLHLVWSPQTTRSGIGGWETHNQIAVYLDRGVVFTFGKR